MKKICTLILSLAIGISIYANPISLPTVEISELYFDNSNNWMLELAYYDLDQTGIAIDSIFLYSTSDTVKLPSHEFLGDIGFWVITKDILRNDFVVKRFGDTIKVVFYVYEEAFEDVLIYGNATEALINFPRLGQSLSRYYMYFIKDNSPTIGEPNDTLGMCGTLRGTVYDKFSTPVQNRSFLLDFNFETDLNGEYSARVLSKPSAFNRIRYKTGQYHSQSVPITAISYIMEPDSIVELDIYLLEELASGTESLSLGKNPIRIYPNPVSINEQLKVDVDLPILTSNIWLEIADVNGKMIKKERIKRLDNVVDAPAISGFYIVSVWLENQIVTSKRILVK